jgi:hypothetical protein
MKNDLNKITLAVLITELALFSVGWVFPEIIKAPALVFFYYFAWSIIVIAANIILTTRFLKTKPENFIYFVCFLLIMPVLPFIALAIFISGTARY